MEQTRLYNGVVYREIVPDPVLPVAPQAEVLTAIRELEVSVTPRRLREAILTPEGAAWLADIEAQIAAKRALL